MKKVILIIAILFGVHFSNAQNLYFPPTTGNTWDTINPSSLNWCQERIDNLYNYLDNTNSKAFILLKDGKIVLEKYFGTFTQDSLHVWNSAGKTLTGFAVGIAQKQGFLNINDTTSQYLGQGWTSLLPQKEEKITILNQLTMTSGMNDAANADCTDPNCLTYLADAGTRWAYHNGPYTLLDTVIESATGQNLNAFINSRIKAPTGMTGFFYQFGYNNVFISKPRSMARFGLLMLAEGNWNGTAVLDDPTYFYNMTHPSQSLNPSYGYLTWLNGQSSYMVPQTQIQFTGSPMPNANPSVYCALGKNGQMINVDPSQNLVFIRMGESDGNSLVTTQYNDTIWQKINQLVCTNDVTEISANEFRIYPNPSSEYVTIESKLDIEKIELFNPDGKLVTVDFKDNKIVVSSLKKGIYWIKIQTQKSTQTFPLSVQ